MALAAAVVVFTALLLLFALQRWGNPNDGWIELSRYLPFYWLALPCALSLGLCAVFDRRWFGLLLGSGALLLLAFGIMDFRWSGATPSTGSVRLMTFNVKAGAAIGRQGGIDLLAGEIRRHAPDIVVMQDADDLLAARTAPAWQGSMGNFGFAYAFALGQYVVASRHPIEGCVPADMGFSGESHRYLRCVVRVDGKALNLVVAHFRSPRGGLMATRHQGAAGVSDWEQNFRERLSQSEALAFALAQMPRPLVVAGDLNAPDGSPVIRTLLNLGLRDAFASAGRGYGYSYGQSMRAGLAFLRIDHILASDDITVQHCNVGGDTTSEHRPVIADLMLAR